jgi:plasmid stabilization system protein ParE
MTLGEPLIYYHRLALQELIEARRWYANQSPRVERRFIVAVENGVRRIQAGPDAGTLFRAPYRWVRLRRFPYLLYYGTIGTGIIEVFAVAHGSRRLGYWLGRTSRP